VVYHIAGCGVCEECRHGYMIGCTSPSRAAHGWQRDGGHAEFLLAEEATCIPLPDKLTYVDGALVSSAPGSPAPASADASSPSPPAITPIGR
jgi:D-arabinose 1-dehydrogenase-like Zn-dependent alcohol dehydrogenase